jgi:hypothetical protein
VEKEMSKVIRERKMLAVVKEVVNGKVILDVGGLFQAHEPLEVFAGMFYPRRGGSLLYTDRGETLDGEFDKVMSGFVSPSEIKDMRGGGDDESK